MGGLVFLKVAKVGLTDSRGSKLWMLVDVERTRVADYV